MSIVIFTLVIGYLIGRFSWGWTIAVLAIAIPLVVEFKYLRLSDKTLRGYYFGFAPKPAIWYLFWPMVAGTWLVLNAVYFYLLLGTWIDTEIRYKIKTFFLPTYLVNKCVKWLAEDLESSLFIAPPKLLLARLTEGSVVFATTVTFHWLFIPTDLQEVG